MNDLMRLDGEKHHPDAVIGFSPVTKMRATIDNFLADIWFSCGGMDKGVAGIDDNALVGTLGHVWEFIGDWRALQSDGDDWEQDIGGRVGGQFDGRGILGVKG